MKSYFRIKSYCIFMWAGNWKNEIIVKDFYQYQQHKCVQCLGKCLHTNDNYGQNTLSSLISPISCYILCKSKREI